MALASKYDSEILRSGLNAMFGVTDSVDSDLIQKHIYTLLYRLSITPQQYTRSGMVNYYFNLMQEVSQHYRDLSNADSLSGRPGL
jgi:hypothetical protein